MKKITGTIIKIIDNKASIMTKDCEMVYIKKQPGMYLGFEIQFGSNEIISNKNKVNMAIKIASPIAAIFILIFLNMHFLHKSDNYTYVCIDGEFSVEYTVDKDMNVVKANSTDKNAQEDLMKIDFKSKPLQDALSAMLKDDKNFAQKSIAGSDCIIISAYTKNKNDDQNYAIKNTEKVLLACKNSVDELDSKVDYRFVGINDNDRKLAKENNISMGRYYIFEKAQEQGKSISLEQAKDMQVVELIDKVNIPYLSISDKTTTCDEKKKVTPDSTINKKFPTAEPKKQIKHDKKDPIGKLEIEEINTIDKDRNSGEDEKYIPTTIVSENNGKTKTPAPILETNDKKELFNGVAPKTNDKKEYPTPVAPNVNDKKEHPTPIEPKNNDKKELNTPVATNSKDKKDLPTPIEQNVNDKKEHPTPIAPKNNDKKELDTPVVPNSKDKKEHTKPVVPKANDKKELPTPVPPKLNEEKELPTPVAPKPNEEKELTTPIEPKADDIKEPLSRTSD